MQNIPVVHIIKIKWVHCKHTTAYSAPQQNVISACNLFVKERRGSSRACSWCMGRVPCSGVIHWQLYRPFVQLTFLLRDNALTAMLSTAITECLMFLPHQNKCICQVCWSVFVLKKFDEGSVTVNELLTHFGVKFVIHRSRPSALPDNVSNSYFTSVLCIVAKIYYFALFCYRLQLHKCPQLRTCLERNTYTNLSRRSMKQTARTSWRWLMGMSKQYT